MADPTMQTFCCRHGNDTEMARAILKHFDTDAYNTVCLVSSTLGILGAIYQILPREEYTNSHRWLSFSATRGRKIVSWLAIADLLAALGVFVRSSIWINFKNIMPATNDDASVIYCAIPSAWSQYFYTATWIWTLCYAIDMRFLLSDKEAKRRYYHLAAWVIPAVTTSTGLSLLYVPNAECHTSMTLVNAFYKILPNYLATYIPILTVMIANPTLYRKSTKDMEKVITSMSGQFTSKERKLLDSVIIKFSCINILFYVCWLPNLVNGVLIWSLWFNLPATCIITVWYIMALTNPLQALFNSFVYRRWNSGSERLVIPWKKTVQYEKTKASTQKSSGTVRDELYPLLQTTPRNSVNGMRSYNSL